MLKKIRPKYPNYGGRVADYSGNTETLAVLAKEGEAERDTLKVKCHLCKSQVLILMENHEASAYALNLNKQNIKLSKKFFLKYHDISQEDYRVTEIRIKREELWTKLITKFRIDSECWNLDEIESAIQSLQEYFSIDYPEELNLSEKQYCRAIDNLSRVSLNCLSIWKSNKTIDIGELSYITKKLMEIFFELGIAKRSAACSLRNIHKGKCQG